GGQAIGVTIDIVVGAKRPHAVIRQHEQLGAEAAQLSADPAEVVWPLAVECPPPCKREHARPARRHVERAPRAAAQHDVGSGFPDSDHGEISCHDVASSKNSAGARARLPIGARVVSGVDARWARAHGLASAGTIAAMPSWRWVAFVLWVT